MVYRSSLDVHDTAANVGYVDAIDAKLYLVAQAPVRYRRWRVNNNLPGMPDFCPLIYLGAKDERQWIYDVAAGVKALDDTYGAELLLRSAAWLTFKESRASFAIEHEAGKDDRVRRFAAVIGSSLAICKIRCPRRTCCHCKKPYLAKLRCGWAFAGHRCSLARIPSAPRSLLRCALRRTAGRHAQCAAEF